MTKGDRKIFKCSKSSCEFMDGNGNCTKHGNYRCHARVDTGKTIGSYEVEYSGPELESYQQAENKLANPNTES